MSRSNVDTTALLNEQRKKIRDWEQAMPGSLRETEAAEAATRVSSELDAALCDGAPLPVQWQAAQYPDSLRCGTTPHEESDPRDGGEPAVTDADVSGAVREGEND